MAEIIEAILASPVVKAMIEGICVKIISDLLHRRATDPDFLTQSDAVFAAISAANSPEALTLAQKDLAALTGS
jgi:hypothetical protein